MLRNLYNQIPYSSLKTQPRFLFDLYNTTNAFIDPEQLIQCAVRHKNKKSNCILFTSDLLPA